MKGLSLFFLVMLTFNLSAFEIKIAIQQRQLERFYSYIGEKDAKEVYNFNGANRDIAELILIQQILYKEYGDKIEVVLLSAPTVLRVFTMLENGEAHIGGNSGWNTTLKKYNLIVSQPIIRRNEFEVGIYVSERNKKLLSITTLDEIRELTFVSTTQWDIDWKTLNDLKIKNILDNPLWKGMVDMLQYNRADAMLAPFQSTEDLSIKYDDGDLIPIPNIKIGLQGERSFYVSKMFNKGDEVLDVLNKSIQNMHDNGEIKKIYTESGFFNPRVKNWKLIVPE